jgi:hypothetical protein
LQGGPIPLPLSPYHSPKRLQSPKSGIPALHRSIAGAEDFPKGSPGRVPEVPEGALCSGAQKEQECHLAGIPASGGRVCQGLSLLPLLLTLIKLGVSLAVRSQDSPYLRIAATISCQSLARCCFHLSNTTVSPCIPYSNT